MQKSLMFVLIALMFCSGCGGEYLIYEHMHAPVTEWFIEDVLPEDRTTARLLYPLTIPAGLICLATDIVIVHPIAIVDDVLDDTKDALWDDFDWDESYVSECASLLPRAAATPIVVVFDYAFRLLFDFSVDGDSDDETEIVVEPKVKVFEEGADTVYYFFSGESFYAPSASVQIPSGMLLQPQLNLKDPIREKVIIALRDSSAPYKAESLPDKKIAGPTLCSIVFNGHKKALIVGLDKVGWYVGTTRKYRFVCPELATLLQGQLASEGLLKGQKGAAIQKALEQAAKAAEIQDALEEASITEAVAKAKAEK